MNINYSALSFFKSDDDQQTLNHQVFVEASSPYTKDLCKMSILPQKNGGIVFQYQNTVIPVLIDYVKDDDSVHTTSLLRDGLEIRTVEHLLSALWGMGVDNALIKMDTPFLPFPDASAQKYTEEIAKVGVRSVKNKRYYLEIKEQIKFTESATDDRFALFEPSNKFEIISTTSFETMIGTETVSLDWTPSSYKESIGWARTFLRSSLDKGVWETVKKYFPNLPANPQESPIIVFDDQKFITPLRTDDEPARHKVLDFIGDMALLGVRVKARVTLNKPGHRFTRQIVQAFSSSPNFPIKL